MSGKRKLPRKAAYVDVTPEQADLGATLAALGLTREQLVDLAIMIGTDFNEGIKGIGPKKALALVRKHGTLEAIFSETGAVIDNADAIREIFLHPNVTDDYRAEWREPDLEGAKRMLVDEHDFSEERIDAAFAKLAEARKREGQKSLDQWF